MPELTISVTTAQWQRIRTAFTVGGVPPNAADMRAWILKQVRDKVVGFEMSQLDEAKNQATADIEAAKILELQNEGWGGV